MAGEDRIGAGLRYIYFGVPNASGYLQGTSATPTANGTIQRMQRLRGAQLFPLTIPDVDRLNVSGDDEPLVQFIFASESLPSGNMGLAVHDMDFDALIQGTKVEPIGNIRAGALAPGGQTYPTLMMLIMREAKKFQGATKGIAAWEGVFLPAVQLSPLGQEYQQRAFSPYQYAIALSKASRAPYGATYTELARGTTEMAIEPLDLDYPLEIYGGFGNGVATSFALDTAPVAADGSSTSVFLNGVKQAYTTNYTVSGLSLVFGVAPGSGVHIGYMQEVNAANLS